MTKEKNKLDIFSGLLPYEGLREEWEKCKKELDLKGTAGEMGTYFGMFMHGWRGRNSQGFWQPDNTTSDTDIQDKILELIDTNNKELFDYIENDAEIVIPIEEYFDDHGKHISKKKYGLVLLKYLCEELRDNFLTKKS